MFGSGQVARLRGPWPASFSPSTLRDACLPVCAYLPDSLSPRQKHPAIWRARELCQKAFDLSTASISRKARLQVWFPFNTRTSWIRPPSPGSTAKHHTTDHLPSQLLRFFTSHSFAPSATPSYSSSRLHSIDSPQMLHPPLASQISSRSHPCSQRQEQGASFCGTKCAKLLATSPTSHPPSWPTPSGDCPFFPRRNIDAKAAVFDLALLPRP